MTTTRCELLRRLMLTLMEHCQVKIMMAVNSRGGRIDLNLEKSMEIFAPLFEEQGDLLLVKSLEGSILTGTLLRPDGSEKPGAMELSELDPTEALQLWQTLYDIEGFGEYFDKHDVVLECSIPGVTKPFDFAWLPVFDATRTKILLIRPKP